MRPWRPDSDSRRFTLAVMPDTQYLFDGASINPAPIEASLRYSPGARQGREHRLPVAPGRHHGERREGRIRRGGQGVRAARPARRGLQRPGGQPRHQVVHDRPARLDPVPGRLRARSASRAGAPSAAPRPDGYNTFHVFKAAGREWLVLALDWRLSAKGYAWANDVIAQHPKTPVILTTHELVYGDDALSSYGQQLWDQLIRDHDQIFLTLNGHYWPAARATRTNAAGNDVHLHLTNYQNRYYGGAAMIRLYRFDLDRDTIDVETVSPWILGRAAKGLNELERQEMELSGDADRFSVDIDFEERFSGFAPVPARPSRPAVEDAGARHGRVLALRRAPGRQRRSRERCATCPGTATI